VTTGILDKFTDVPSGICNGFDLGTPVTHPLVTFTPPNHKSALDHSDVIYSSILVKLSVEQYSGPFSPTILESLISIFCSSLLGVVPKSIPGEFHIIQDFSFPQNNSSLLSVNSEINLSNFSCN